MLYKDYALFGSLCNLCFCNLHGYTPIFCTPRECRKGARNSGGARVAVPVRASVTPHKRRYTYYNKMFKPICYALPAPLKVSLV